MPVMQFFSETWRVVRFYCNQSIEYVLEYAFDFYNQAMGMITANVRKLFSFVANKAMIKLDIQAVITTAAV